MAAETSPTVEDNGTQVVALLRFVEEDVVAPECLAERIGVGAGKILLPVEPPKVDSFSLMVADNCREERFCEVGPVETPADIVLAVIEVFARELAVHLFEIVWRLCLVDAVGRMKVQCRPELVGVHLSKQTFGVGNKVSVPRPSRPSSASFRHACSVAVPVPVHIENHYVGRDIVVLQVTHYLSVVVGGIGGILAVPISENVIWRKWYASGYLGIVAYSLAVVAAIAEEVDIHGMRIGTIVPPRIAHIVVGHKGIRASAVGTRCAPRVIDDCPS